MGSSATALDLAPARPFLKWAGGKTHVLNQIMPHFPLRFGRYHEPFMGGGAVFFHLRPSSASLSDVNPDLVNAYRSIRDDVSGTIRHLRRHRATQEHFYRVRSMNPARMSSAGAAARTVFLNRTCFNGLYRVNAKGHFNVPFGRYKNPTICDESNLYAVSDRLQAVDLKVRDALTGEDAYRAGDLVYFDPPYVPLSRSSSFVGYARGGFGEEEQKRLAALYRRLAARGVQVYLSNSDTPWVRTLYRGFEIQPVYARRAINSRADRRGPVGEVLVTPKPVSG